MPESEGRVEKAMGALWRFLIRLALIAAIIFAAYRLRNLITTVFVAALVAYVMDPMVDWLCRQEGFVRFHNMVAHFSERVGVAYRRVFYRQVMTVTGRVHMRRHVLRVYATLYVFVATVFVLWHGIRFVVSPVTVEIKQAINPAQQRKIREGLDRQLKLWDQGVPDWAEWAKSDSIRDELTHIDYAKNSQELMTQLGHGLLEGAKNIIEVVMLPVLAFYFLVDGRKLKHEFVGLVPRRYQFEVMRMMYEFNRIMRAFIMGQVILCLLAGVVVGLGLAWLKVPYPLVMGVLAGVTRAIPIVGPVIGGIPIVILTLISKGPTTALAVLAFFSFLHFAEGKFVMPLLIGDRMELHPVIIIVVLLAGGEIGNILIGGTTGSLLGMVFAAPITSIARVMIRRYWLGLRHRSGARHHKDSLTGPPAVVVDASPDASSIPGIEPGIQEGIPVVH